MITFAPNMNILIINSNMKHLVKGLAAMLLGFTVASCVGDAGYVEPDKSADYKKNAENKLGITIPDNQDYTMVATATVATTVNLVEGESYTVRVYANDPVQEGVGKYIATGTVQNGNTFTTNVTYPSAKNSLFIGATDSKGYTIYKQVEIVNSQAIANISTKNTTAASRGTRSITVGKDTYDKFTFPTSAELTEAFPSTIPDNAEEVKDLQTIYPDMGIWNIYANKGKDHNYKITNPGDVQIGGGWYNSVNTMYNVYVDVDGDVNLSCISAACCRLFILRGNVTLDANFGEWGGFISVAPGATVNDLRSRIANNSYIKVYNRGTFNAKNADGYDVNNNATIFNEATFDVTGPLKPNPGQPSFIICSGENAVLTAPSLEMNSVSNFYNSGTVTITGLSHVTSANVSWINNGHYTTGSMQFSAWNGTYYNYCQLTVVNNCNFQDGQFNMMENSYAEFGTAYFNNFRVNMENHSAFYVKGDNSWGAQGDGNYQGFNAVAGAEAYVKLSGTTTIASHKNTFLTNEGINLAHGELNDLGKDNTGDQPTHVFGGTEVSDENLTFIKSAEGCGASIITGGRIDPVEPEVYTYAFEDTDDGDYDLNDLVLRINEKADDATKLVVTLVAAGADYDIETYVNNQILTFNGETEVHRAFLGEDGAKKHINTESTVGGKRATADFVSCVIDKPADFNNDFTSLKVSIKVLNTDKTYSYPNTNAYPNAIMMPGKWKWPKETVRITTAYSEGYATDADHSFGTWASEYPHVQALDWYDYPVSSQVVDMER